ncbi:MAG: Crp/Fnr family transcriptional regulator [Rhizomicrobium sp.]
MLIANKGLFEADSGVAKAKARISGGATLPSGAAPRPGNQILRLLPRGALDTLSPWLRDVDLNHGETLFEPGDDVTHAFFPLDGAVIALVLPMQDGHAVEAATIGREGAVGGVVSLGMKPAFARGLVQIPGKALRIPVGRLEAAKRSSPRLHDIFARYADCLVAQVFQSVGCSMVHPLEARCARWLLLTHDRLQRPDLPLTQEALAEMFGVARTYLTRVASTLQRRGAISHRRGIVHIEQRALLEEATCECYGTVRRHFERILPGLYPDLEA